MKRQLARAKARARVLILDCCFSGRAIEAMGHLPSLVSGQLPMSGTYILTSTSATGPSYAPPKDRNTAFTGALLAALNQPEPLRLDEIYQHVRRELDGLGLIAPRCQVVGDAARTALARGAIPAPAPRSSTPRQRVPAKVRWMSGAALAIAMPATVWAVAYPLDGRPLEKKPTPTSQPAVTSAAPTPSTTSPTAHTSPPSGSPATRSQQLTVGMRRTKQTTDGAVTIGLTSAVGHIDEKGSSTIFGDGSQTSGGSAVTADQKDGSGTVAFADFYVETPTRTCKARGVAVGDSTVVPESSTSNNKWTRITVLTVEDAVSGAGNISVTFRVNQGHGKAPESDATCA
jgi:hypothetical protein